MYITHVYSVTVFRKSRLHLLKKISFPSKYHFPTHFLWSRCLFLCIQNAERTCTHKVWKATTDQWSSFQCICFSGMEKVSLVQEGLIQIANQTPSWASLTKVCYLHTKNMTAKHPSSGMLLSRVFAQFNIKCVKPIWQPLLLDCTMHAPPMWPIGLWTKRLGWFCL